jgi:hypothetical protein
MTVESCIPVIPSVNLEKSLRVWVDGLGFEMDTEMRAEDRLIFCMLHKAICVLCSTSEPALLSTQRTTKAFECTGTRSTFTR